MAAFTYDLSTDVGKVRFEIGDHVEEKAVFTDAEIEYALTGRSVKLAAATLCDQLATRYAAIPSFTTDGVTVSGADVAKSYREAAKRLREAAGNALTSVHATRVDGYTEGVRSDSNDLAQPWRGVGGGQDSPLDDYDVGRWDEMIP